jgi:hypothetical protein
MKNFALFVLCSVCFAPVLFGGEPKPLFAPDLSNADFNKNVWSIDKDGVLSATADQSIWTADQYENYELTLEFKTDNGTNSGVIIYCSDKKNWIPNAVEIQIADDYYEKFNKEWSKDWFCAAVFGHLPPSKTKIVKKPGEWNTMKITARGQQITVELNGLQTTEMDMKRWTSGTENPDGTKIPAWMPKPFAELQTKGYIGFQGKHGDALIWFRNINIKAL